MVRDRVITAAVQKMHLSASDMRLASALKEIPAIASLRRADGSLDVEAYKALVGAQGLTPEGFEANVRYELSAAQVLGGVMQSSFGTESQYRQAMDALLQRREIQVALFKPADFSAKVNPSSAELEAFYQAHTANFQQPEEAVVEYVMLDLEAVSASLSLSEDDLRTYYKENLDRLGGKEERRASHILLNATKDMPLAERDKAKARAQELLAQVRKNPSNFAEIAKKESQDSGSAPTGGDLGFFARGAMVKPFEDAAFALNKGDVSDVVESDFGYHIITVTDIKAPKPPSFESVRAKLEEELKQQQAQRKFAEVAEIFTNGVYEQSDSLQPTADKLKLTIHKVEHVSRTPQPGTRGPLGNARFLEALFSNDALENKRNTEAIEMGPSQLVAGRVVTYTPARTLPLTEVHERVRTAYIAQQAAKLAQAEGRARAQEWKAQPNAAKGLSAPVTVARDQLQGLAQAVVDAALQADTSSLPDTPVWTGVDLGTNGFAVVKVNRIVARDAGQTAQEAALRPQFQQWLGTAEGVAYYELLKERFKVQIKVQRPSI